MRIVWVKVGGLWPANMGGRLRSFNMLAELSRRHRVTVLTTHDPRDSPAELERALPACEEIISVPYSIPRRGSIRFAKALARSWISPLPVDALKCRVPSLRAAVRRALVSGADLCVADFLVAMANVSPQLKSVPTVLFEHNVEYMIWKRLADVDGRRWRRALLTLEWRKMRRYEAAACRRVALTIGVSETDRALLQAVAPEALISTIPTGVDASYFRPDSSRETAASLVFTGAMDWYPNEDAIIHFIETTLPAIRNEIPLTTLAVVGRNPGDRLRRAAAAARVEVTGTVDDVRPYVAKAAVYVVPLRVGGGTRLKIFEALAMGKAVVTTTVGAEGLPVTPGEHLLRADSPGDFGRAVVTLLRDRGLRDKLGAAGRRLVEERHSWAVATKEFERLCEEIRLHHAG